MNNQFICSSWDDWTHGELEPYRFISRIRRANLHSGHQQTRPEVYMERFAWHVRKWRMKQSLSSNNIFSSLWIFITGIYSVDFRTPYVNYNSFCVLCRNCQSMFVKWETCRSKLYGRPLTFITTAKALPNQPPLSIFSLGFYIVCASALVQPSSNKICST